MFIEIGFFACVYLAHRVKLYELQPGTLGSTKLEQAVKLRIINPFQEHEVDFHGNKSNMDGLVDTSKHDVQAIDTGHVFIGTLIKRTQRNDHAIEAGIF